MNKKNGITMIALVATITVLLIFTSTSVISFNKIFTSTKKKQFASEMYAIQKLVDQYYFRNNSYPVEGDPITDFSNVEEGDDGEIYKLDLYELGVEETSFGQKNEDATDENDIFLVSIKTGTVYYKKGYVIDNNTYYYLTNELKNNLNL